MNQSKIDLAVREVAWESELKGAAMLIKSKLAPKDIQTPEAALFCILAGRDLGLSPVQSLRSIRPIQGKIELSADLQLGLFHREGGKSSWAELTDNRASLKLLAPWSLEPHVSTFTLDEAKRAGLLGNSTWAKYPKAMLRSRAITQGLKDIGFLAGAGVYAPGEISGNAVVDESTGEVLPTAERHPESVQFKATDGVLERMDDGEQAGVRKRAEQVSEAVTAGDMESAATILSFLDQDQKVAVWHLLDSPVKKALKKYSADQQRALEAPQEVEPQQAA